MNIGKASNRYKTLQLVTVDLGEGYTLNIKFDKSNYTPRFEKQQAVYFQQGLPVNAISYGLVSLIKEWDAEFCDPEGLIEKIMLLKKDIKSLEDAANRAKKTETEKSELTFDKTLELANLIQELSSEEYRNLPTDETKMVAVPVDKDIIDAIFPGEMLGNILEQINESQRPNRKPSDFTSVTS